MHTQRRVGRTVTILGVMLVLLGAACAGGDKAGGQDRTEPTVLTFALNQAYLPAQLDQFPADVERLSGGSLRVALTGDFRVGQPDQQRGVVADIQAGHADLGWVES